MKKCNECKNIINYSVFGNNHKLDCGYLKSSKKISKYSKVLTKEFYQENYINKKLTVIEMSELVEIPTFSIRQYAHKHGFKLYTISESMRTLDYATSYLNKNLIEHIDGFLLGDGSLTPNHKTKVGRFHCGLEHEEFCNFMMKDFHVYGASVEKHKANSMNQGFVFGGRTKFHPDIYKQYLRWYKPTEMLNSKGDIKYKKTVPEDVELTPKSVMLWYLGDGCLKYYGKSAAIQLSTDGFNSSCVDFLIYKLKKDTPIQGCHRSNSNRIRINCDSVKHFFDFIGRTSPVSCYDYKFDLPEWKFESRTLIEASKELNVDYNRLCYLVKSNRLPCFREKDNSRARLLKEHFNIAKQMIQTGELY